MRFWDSSALVPLLVQEPSTQAMLAGYEDDPEVVVWWATEIECLSALVRLERDEHLAGPALAHSLRRLNGLSLAWREVQPTTRVRQTAARMLRVHALRAADALQLAAAMAAAEDEPVTLPLVTLDDRLAQAAAREGFIVIGQG